MLPAKHAFARPPAMTPEPVIALDAPTGDAVLNTAPLQMFAATLEVIAFVGMQALGPVSRSARQSSDGMDPATVRRRWGVAEGQAATQKARRWQAALIHVAPAAVWMPSWMHVAFIKLQTAQPFSQDCYRTFSVLLIGEHSRFRSSTFVT
jgi:hypothetical protein